MPRRVHYTSRQGLKLRKKYEMKIISRTAFAIVAAAFFSVSAMAAGVKTGKAAPDFTLKDPSGAEHSLSQYRGKYVVLEWVNFECPFVKKHYSNGDMQSLQRKYTAEGVVWLSICSSAPGKQGYLKPRNAAKKIEKNKFSATAYLLDEEGRVGRLFGAKTTPHMYVVDPSGAVAYQGAIDSIRSFDSSDIANAENYVAECLDAGISGKVIPASSTPPYGCSVKY